MILSLIVKTFFENDPETKLTYHDFQAMLQLAETSQSGRRYLIGHIECIREHERLIFKPAGRTDPESLACEIVPGETYTLSTVPYRFSSQLTGKPDMLRLGQNPEIEYIDKEKIMGRLFLRTWEPGDSFYPIGMNSSKKLSDFFTDRKIPQSRRNLIPILVDRSAGHDRIIWICGQRLDNRYKIDSNTTHIIKLECHGYETKPQD